MYKAIGKYDINVECKNIKIKNSTKAIVDIQEGVSGLHIDQITPKSLRESFKVRGVLLIGIFYAVIIERYTLFFIRKYY